MKFKIEPKLGIYYEKAYEVKPEKIKKTVQKKCEPDAQIQCDSETYARRHPLITLGFIR